MAGWQLHTAGSGDEKDTITLVREDAPRIYMEIHVPGISSVIGRDQTTEARQKIQDAVHAIQEALDDPSTLPGHPSR